MIYGPNTEAVQSIIDRIPALTTDEVNLLDAAWAVARDASRSAARSAARCAARCAAWCAAWGAANDAIFATVTYDLATEEGHYTITQRDLLLAPWVSVCGMPDGLDGEPT